VHSVASSWRQLGTPSADYGCVNQAKRNAKALMTAGGGGAWRSSSPGLLWYT